MGREREIVKHLSLCASLMSDPKILTEYSDIVADQFNAAKKSIEALGSLLAPRPVDACGCSPRGWMDLSIISKGVGHLVRKTLDEHMRVVRTKAEDFPKVIHVDFKASVADDPENYIIREIKESCCMGSIVVLYYYLYWYLLLILFNKREDAMYCTTDVLDIKWLLENLPRSKAFFENRVFGEIFRKIGNEAQDAYVARVKPYFQDIIMKNKFMISGHAGLAVEVDKSRSRKTVLISTFRCALDVLLGFDMKVMETAHEFPLNLLERPSLMIFKAVDADIAMNHFITMAGMLSVFETQHQTQKWIDMYKDIEISAYDGSNAVKKIGKLATILKFEPYSKSPDEWVAKGRKSCIYDYCSASLMMDICKSFQKLSNLVRKLLDNAEDIDILKF